MVFASMHLNLAVVLRYLQVAWGSLKILLGYMFGASFGGGEGIRLGGPPGLNTYSEHSFGVPALDDS